ncbi:hypothetical protein NUW58_g9393 [Xylaria curta]|uniref:Uncharacterized protein n=1 Tax=Xylaria curta TaxID=42375 RepID=A0ACC1MYR8_9PEZI|nr:hypothetical protein NUW58_g9393 [Xylaria curta]
MAAFRGAIGAGDNTPEADLHLSKDDCSWDELSTLRTLREPSQLLPPLVGLLEYLNQPAAEHAWLLLDIKTDDDAGKPLTAVAIAIASVPATKRPWTERIMLGPWDLSFVILAQEMLETSPRPPSRPDCLLARLCLSYAAGSQSEFQPLQLLIRYFKRT